MKIFESKSNTNFKLHEVNIKESSFEINSVERELMKYFILKNVETEDHKKIRNNTERVYFVCQKR